MQEAADLELVRIVPSRVSVSDKTTLNRKKHGNINGQRCCGEVQRGFVKARGRRMEGERQRL